MSSRGRLNYGTDFVLNNGKVGLGTDTPTSTLEVKGSFAATTKSFVIKHPSQENKILRYGCLEGPENGVYVRGKANSSDIELPYYWKDLIDAESITVNLTSKNGKLHSVRSATPEKIEIECVDGDIDCYFTVYGERKDVSKLIVEE